MARVCVVTASEFTVQAFLMGHLARLAREHEVTVVTDKLEPARLRDRGIRATVTPLAIERGIDPRKDVVASAALLRVFTATRFDLVYSVTPKSGLLAMSVGLAARIPVRVHTFTGQVWATKRGVAREVLKNADRFIAACATRVLVDSPSQRDFLLQERVIPREKSGVLANGSISGVDVSRFRVTPEQRASARGELGIGEQDFVFLFVGRLNRDKGVLDLALAFRDVAAKHPSARLFVVGPDEGGITREMQEAAGAAKDAVRFVGRTPLPERFMAAADCFTLPSYREGFGTSIIEAACAGLPAIASRIYGVTDAVVDGETGLLHAPHDVAAIRDAMLRVLEDCDLTRRMGSAAEARAARDFSAERLSEEFARELNRLLEEAGITR
jgi:glycosyltransferase involved in cell wall biosynthesis